MILGNVGRGSLRQYINVAVAFALISVSAVLLISGEIRNNARLQQTEADISMLHVGLLETLLDLQAAQLRELGRTVAADRQIDSAFRNGLDQVVLERALDGVRDERPIALILTKYPSTILASSADSSVTYDYAQFSGEPIVSATTQLVIGVDGAPTMLQSTPVRRGARTEGAVHILLPLNNVIDEFFPDLAGLAFKPAGGTLTFMFGEQVEADIDSDAVISMVSSQSGLRFEATQVSLGFGETAKLGNLVFLREVTQSIQQEEFLTNFTILAVCVVIFISLGLLTRALRIGFRPLEAVVRLLHAMSQGNNRLKLRQRGGRSSLVRYSGPIARADPFNDDVDVPYREIGTILTAVETFRESIDAQRTLVVVQEQLENAKRIQQSLLPQKFDQHMGLDIFGQMRPALEVAGDFFDIFRLDDSKLAIVIADVSGKGIAPALFASQASAHFRAQCHQAHDPSTAIRLANNALCERNPEDMFLTCILAVITPETGMVEFVNAGHCPPIVIRANGDVDQIETDPEPIVGVVPDFDWTCHQFQLKVGDRCLFYSDGFDEAQTSTGEMLGVNTVLEMFQKASSSRTLKSETIAATLFQGIDEFSEGAPQADDITIITLRSLAGA